MFKISLASLVVALASISALAAPQASEHERALQRATKWSDVTAQLKGRLPSNVVREFDEFAKGVEFPASRRIKNKLVLTQADGSRVSVEYKKDGAILLNGKEWKLRPLATVEEEITRLALFIAGEKKAEAGMFGLIPAAQAGGPGALGAATVAFAGANTWKAESCGEKNLQGDLVNDCPLMAVGMQPMIIKVKNSPGDFRPILLKCPKENGGVLELVTKNSFGQSEKIQISYNKETATNVTLSVAEKNTDYDSWLKVNFSDAKDDLAISMAKDAVSKYDSIRTKTCNGTSKDKVRFLSMLDANRKELGDSGKKAAGDDEASMEAI